MIPGQDTGLPPLTRRLLGWEIVVVFAVSLGASGLLAVISLIGSLTAREGQTLQRQQALLVGSLAPGRPLLDLTLQLANLLVAFAPVALVFYMLARSGESPSSIGLDTKGPPSTWPGARPWRRSSAGSAWAST